MLQLLDLSGRLSPPGPLLPGVFPLCRWLDFSPEGIIKWDIFAKKQSNCALSWSENAYILRFPEFRSNPGSLHESILRQEAVLSQNLLGYFPRHTCYCRDITPSMVFVELLSEGRRMYAELLKEHYLSLAFSRLPAKWSQQKPSSTRHVAGL